MHPIIETNLAAIRALAREYGVVRLEVFGSVCTPEFDPETSDVDFLVEYPTGYDFGPLLRRFHALRRALADVLRHEVDLVDARALRDPWFLEEADKTRSVIFDASDIAQIACELILARTEGRTFDEYMADPYFRASIERFFEVAGEALRRLERKDPATASVIPDSRDVIDFRNVLAHGYDTERHDEAWAYIQTDLRPLRDRVAALLTQDDEPDAW